MTVPPSVSRRVVEALLAEELPRSSGRRLLLVHGRYDEAAPAEFTAEIHGEPRRVRVTHQPSVLGILDAWHGHRAATGGTADLLVVTTTVEDSQLGWDLRGHAIRGRTRTVDRVEVVAQRFGASDADPRIRRQPWLVDALLDAEPPGGWPPAGTLLTRDVAVRALIAARLGGRDIAGSALDAVDAVDAVDALDALDAGALLDWSRTGVGPARFAGLAEAERTGLTRWLAEAVGPAAPVVMALAGTGRAADAMALGVVGAVLSIPGVPAEAVLAYGSLLGAIQPRPEQLRAFADAVAGVLERWVAEAETSGPRSPAGRRVLAVVDRADQLAAGAGLALDLAGNRFLPSGFQARLRDLAGALSPALDPAAVAAAEAALAEVDGHVLARLYPARLGVAVAAVRLTRWLAGPPPALTSVPAGIANHLADWGWVDRALGLVWAGDEVDDPVVSGAYRRVHDAARRRRDALDEAFAGLLVPWTARAAPVAPGGALLVEDVLDTVVRPLSARQAPLLIMLDGMSSAIAAAFGEQVDGQGWVEVSPFPGRRAAAIAAIPSVAAVNRTAVLTGRLDEAGQAGGSAAERDGFAAFWAAHHRTAALFHQRDLGGGAGHRLAEPLVAALAGDGPVGVVVNTIADALVQGQPGGLAGWTLDSVAYLRELLDTARGYGRPVILVSGNGHVLDRPVPDPVAGTDPAAGTEPPAGPDAARAARWRTGAAGPGEVELAGPRVRFGDGRVVVPWREEIRYTGRRAGYHGGASLAEMTAPVLVLTPTAESAPAGWSILSPEAVRPPWWEQRASAMAGSGPAGAEAGSGPAGSGTAGSGTAQAGSVPAAAPETGRRRGRTPAPQEPGLFEIPGEQQRAGTGPPPARSLGSRVVSGETYAAQRAYVRRPPEPAVIAAVLDALAAADGTLSLAAVAAAAGRAGRNPDFLAATLERLLNVEGYPVLSIVDGGRRVRLDIPLLREQFGLGPR